MSNSRVGPNVVKAVTLGFLFAAVSCSGDVTAPPQGRTVDAPSHVAPRPSGRRNSVVREGHTLTVYDDVGHAYTLDVNARSLRRASDGTTIVNIPVGEVDRMADNLAQMATTEHLVNGLHATPPPEPPPPTECERRGLPPNCGYYDQSVPTGPGEGLITAPGATPVAGAPAHRTPGGMLVRRAGAERGRATTFRASDVIRNFGPRALRGPRERGLARALSGPDWNCLDLSRSIYGASQQWRQSRHVFTETLKDVVADAVQIGLEGAAIDWHALPFEASARLAEAYWVNERNVMELEILATWYHDFNCWDVSTWQDAPAPHFDWARDTPSGVGGANPGPGGGAPGIVCHAEEWEISYDGGETWSPITVRVCEYQMT